MHHLEWHGAGSLEDVAFTCLSLSIYLSIIQGGSRQRRATASREGPSHQAGGLRSCACVHGILSWSSSFVSLLHTKAETASEESCAHRLMPVQATPSASMHMCCKVALQKLDLQRHLCTLLDM